MLTLFQLANCRAEVRVLIPGAGLGRIVYEVLRAGFEVQGNELEFCMLMASNLALNELTPRLCLLTVGYTLIDHMNFIRTFTQCPTIDLQQTFSAQFSFPMKFPPKESVNLARRRK